MCGVPLEECVQSGAFDFVKTVTGDAPCMACSFVFEMFMSKPSCLPSWSKKLKTAAAVVGEVVLKRKSSMNVCMVSVSDMGTNCGSAQSIMLMYKLNTKSC